MKNTLATMAACLVLTSTSAMADTQAFRGIIGVAANIERDAAAISLDLKKKNFDTAKVKADSEALGKDIAALSADVDALDKTIADLGPQQKKNWELVKLKVQLLTIFHGHKSELLNADPTKNRSLIRAHADGLAQRARMLQETANKLDR